MCGLVGMAGDLEYKDEAMMKRLLLFDFLRGSDSTGIAAYKKNKTEASIFKVASHPIDLFDSTKFKALLSGNQCQVFLGHNRAATAGKVNGVNAHPFQMGNIFGAHNGTLYEFNWRDIEKKLDEKFDVDSAALFAAIDKLGIEEAIKMCEYNETNSQKGAWALTWFDTSKNKLYFLRNKHRPLWIAYNEDVTKMMWASEWWMMEAAIASGNASDWKPFISKKGNQYFNVTEDTLIEIDLDELRDKNKKKPKDKPVWPTKEVKGTVLSYSKPNTPPFTAGHSYFQTSTTHSKTTGDVIILPTANNGKTEYMIEVIGSPRRPFGGVIDITDFYDIAKSGCSWCGKDVEYGDTGVIIWERHDTILGKCCSGLTPNLVKIHADPLTYDQFAQRRQSA